MEEKDLRVGIIGTGWIAEKAAYTLQRQEGLTPLAVGSRTQEKPTSLRQSEASSVPMARTNS